MVLEEYKDIVGAAAGGVTLLQVFAPAFICKDIIKQGNTENVSPTPFVGGLGMSLIVLKYGFILKDPTIIPVNLFGLTLNLIYLSIFTFYCDNRLDLFKKVFKVLLGAGAILLYATVESESRIETTYGLIMTAIMFTLIGAPLLELKTIIKNKNTGTIPFPMVLSGTIVTSLWLLYGIILKNIFMQIQNVVALALCLFQLSLFVIYPSPKPKKKES